MRNQDEAQEFRRRFEEGMEARRKAHLEELKREQAERAAQQRKRQRADAWASCVSVLAVLGLIVGGAWWGLSSVASWWQADAAAARAAREQADVPAPGLPAPNWHLSHPGDDVAKKTTTLWTDMHETARLSLLQHESAEDTRSTRVDELDDYKGLSSNDVELTIQHGPEHGTLTVQDGTGLYTPTTGFRGFDTVDYTIKLRDKPELRRVRFTVEVGLSFGARYDEEHKYENCAAARAAGVAPIYQGQDGYGRHLDADRDGVACE
ncbi:MULTISPECIES: excalibur calcium-binding domain-containing protein [unclassified Streptomyces]|uniref:excalibur calcium-binding domain-containing protein n=1 Tax=unclassified Streptomyces TaxID=2593676 RepID=UPI002E34FAFC|nr:MULTISPECIES: excalibur calcium-binding domain-containing protein [unclassified Streptomyces]WUC69172.1 excalibur calcium-binding domain-containing protein [Streptomyces sp. NBC_00539]